MQLTCHVEHSRREDRVGCWAYLCCCTCDNLTSTHKTRRGSGKANYLGRGAESHRIFYPRLG